MFSKLNKKETIIYIESFCNLINNFILHTINKLVTPCEKIYRIFNGSCSIIYLIEKTIICDSNKIYITIPSLEPWFWNHVINFMILIFRLLPKVL